jgi:hypothetical protein
MTILLPMTSDAASLSLDYSLGFNGYFRLDTWTPLTVVLENRGRTTRGTLEVIVTSGSEFLRTVHQTVHTMAVELPYNSTKLASFTIHLSTFTHDLLIQLRDDNGQILISSTVSLRSAYTERPMVVVLDERITPDFLSVLPRDRFAVNAQPRFLPETVFGYDGVEMLIVNAEILKSLRDAQFQALQKWLEQGGFLVTAGGMNYGVLYEQRWQHLLPIRIREHREFSELASLTEFCGQSLNSERPFLILDATIPDGQVLLQEQGIHVLTEKRIGAGKLVFLAVDPQHPPFSRWDGRQAFWEETLMLRPEGMQGTFQTNKQTMLDTLLENMPARFPDTRVAFVFLGLYALLFKLITTSYDRRGVKNWKVLTLVSLLVLAFSGISYGLFFYPKQVQRLAYDSILHVHASGNDTVALGEFMLGLYGLKNTPYTLGFEETTYPVRIVPGDLFKQTPAPYVLQHTDTGLQIQGALEKWSYNFFTFATPLDFEMRAEAYHDAQTGLSLTLSNPSPHALQAIYGYFAGRLFPLGKVAADTTVTKTLNMAQIQEQELFDTGKLRTMFENLSGNGRLPFWQQMQSELSKYLLTRVHQTYNGREDLFVLVGWMPANGIDIHLKPSGHIGDSVTLVTWAVPVQ